MKRSIRCLCICLAAMLLLPAAQAEAALPLTDADFCLTYQGADYALGQDAAPLLAAMTAQDGCAPEVYSAESCLFDGLDKEYTGAELIAATYPLGAGGGDVLETLILIGGAHRTARGIGLGATLAEVEAAYGSGFTRDGDVLTYAVGDPWSSPVLMFTLDPQTQTVLEILMMNNTGF